MKVCEEKGEEEEELARMVGSVRNGNVTNLFEMICCVNIFTLI